MSATSAPTLRKLPERMTLRVISPKERSTRLSQKEEVGISSFDIPRSWTGIGLLRTFLEHRISSPVAVCIRFVEAEDLRAEPPWLFLRPNRDRGRQERAAKALVTRVGKAEAYRTSALGCQRFVISGRKIAENAASDVLLP